MLSEIRQIQKEDTTLCHLYEESKIVRLRKAESRMVVAYG